MKYVLYFKKHASGYTMRYGVYLTRQDAESALRHWQSVNTIDTGYIEELKHEVLQ